MGILSKILQIFKIPELRNKLFFVFAMLVIFRIMANIPISAIDQGRLREFFAGNQLFGLLNVFTGGAMDNLSIVMLGVGPYITATIVLQLLTMIFPALEKLYKEEGEQGKQKFNQYGRMLTVPFAFLQGYAFLTILIRQQIIEQPSLISLIPTLLTITAGTIFLMWIGELITEKGIGNGVSLVIFAGIVSGLPTSIRQLFLTWDASQLVPYVGFFVVSFLIIAGVVMITDARRNIPVSYAKRVRGNRMYGGVSTYLPLNVNPAGVLPIIFALSLLLFPGMIASFFQSSPGIAGSIAGAIQNFVSNPWTYGFSYFLLVGVFTYFYTSVTFDPKAIASNLQKMGGFVPGVRPGVSTVHFLNYVLNRILLIGALFLGSVALMPSIVQGVTGVQTFGFLVGGTSLLILVSVVLETIRQLRSQLQMRDYDTF